MGKPHVHAELIKAWADGADIEYFDAYSHDWNSVKDPMWDVNTEYRIKPKPEYKTNTFYKGTFRDEEVILVHFDTDNFRVMYPNGSVGWLPKNNLELLVTGELK